MTMEFLRDYQIPAKIIDLIKVATTELIIVSPWLELKDDTYLVDALEDCIRRDVKIEVFCKPSRKGSKTESALEKIKHGLIDVVYVRKLHAKMIITDSKGLLVTSANLIETSQTVNHETGLFTSNSAMINQAMQYLTELRHASEGKPIARQFCKECNREIKVDPDKPWCRDCWDRLPSKVQQPYTKRWKARQLKGQ